MKYLLLVLVCTILVSALIFLIIESGEPQNEGRMKKVIIGTLVTVVILFAYIYWVTGVI